MTESTETRSPQFTREAAALTYRDVHLPLIFVPWAEVLLGIVAPRAGDAVLDVACGPGTIARAAARRAGRQGRVVGVDISAPMLAIARDWAVEPGAAPIEYVESSATSMPVPDAAFSVAYCQQGLQHMTDPVAALGEMRRALEPGGRLGIALWIKSPFSMFREVVAGLGLGDNGPQPSGFGRDALELQRVLEQTGFKDVVIEQREMTAVLERGVPQALEIAFATSVHVALVEGSPEQKETIRKALEQALEPLVFEDGVHLTSTANIASARRA